MKFVVAMDSFKEACSAEEACLAVEEGIRKVVPDAQIVLVPVADGGEGTMQTLVDASQGSFYTTLVEDPLGREICARFGVLGDEKTAVIEMAAASGLDLLQTNERNPLYTSTFGTGQLIKAALEFGVKKIILGIGGSATNDGGAGMAQAIGFGLLDKEGRPLKRGNAALAELVYIDQADVDPRLAECEIIVACDVKNPLTGPEGASYVFGPQKGADDRMVEEMDQHLNHYAKIIQEQLGKNVSQEPGTGAAGGLGAGLSAFTSADLKSGIEVVFDAVQLEKKMQGMDVCFTGEGQLDFQTQYGKTPYGVLQYAKKISPQSKVIALAGGLGEGVEDLYKKGFDAVLSIAPGAAALEELIQDTRKNLTYTSMTLTHLLKT